MRKVACLVGWFLTTAMLGSSAAQTAAQPSVDDLRLADVTDRVERLEAALEELAGHVRLAGVQVQSGRVSLPYRRRGEARPAVREGGNRGGSRGVQDRVVFPEPFESVPKVTMALSLLDISSAANTRVVVTVDAVDEKGFDYVFFTWGNTHVYEASAVWVAVAQ